jgi:signal transduction histidine kinase/response regulator of citrate/malate metabolism/DNA-binding CsgD family transcriptional regulator
MADPPVRLLVVEDNPGDLRLVELELAEAVDIALDLEHVATMADACAALAQREFDLVLLDLFLPDSQGVETLHTAAKAADGTSIIALTEHVTESIGIDCLRGGADDFLRKDEIGSGALVRSVRYALERQRRSRHEQFLGHVLTAISGSLDADAALRTLAHLAVPALADWCLVEVIGEEREVRLLEIVASDSRKQALLQAKLSSYPHGTNGGPHPVDEVLRSGTACLIPEFRDEDLRRIAHDAMHLRLLQELDPRSMMIVPLIAQARVVGALTFTASESGRVYDTSELHLVEEVARSAAAIVENAHRFEQAEQGKRSAEETTERMRRIERVSSALAAALTPRQVATAMINEGLHAVDASAAALLICREGTSSLDLMRSAGLTESDLPLWSQLTADEASPVADALRTGAEVRVRDRAELVERYPAFAAGTGAGVAGGLLALPLIAAERVMGTVVFLFPGGREVPDAESSLLDRCASECASALDRAFLFEREQRALAEARAAARLRDEVLSIVAHDLRNPVSAIAMYASLLGDTDVEREKRRAWARGVHEMTDQIQKLIQDLLDVGKIESGTLTVDTRSVGAQVLVQDAMVMMEPVAAAAGVRIQYEPAGSLPTVNADADRVRQVFSNLLGNAIRFSPAGGAVTIRAESLGNEVLYLVTDSGPGIPLEDRPHLFDRFWQARHSRRGGAGLGLAIAKGIVERHGGRIGVESRPGSGSTFFFTLPCPAASREDEVVSPPADEEVVSTAGHTEEPAEGRDPQPVRARVLLVDDHPLVRRGVREQLELRGRYAVVAEAANAEDAVRQAHLARPDVVLMDLHLPGTSGIDATRTITSELPDVTVLVLSGEAESDVLLEVLEAGGSGFVRKSTAEQDLLPALETVLQGEVFLYPSGNKLLLGGFRYANAEAGSSPVDVLNENERQVLAFAAEGFNSTEIGKKLFLSPKTVDSYRARAMRKLGLGSRPDLVRFAMRTGLLAAR